MTNRLTALEITPADSTGVEQPFTQGEALSLAYATLHALTAPASEALFPVSPSPVNLGKHFQTGSFLSVSYRFSVSQMHQVQVSSNTQSLRGTR